MATAPRMGEAVAPGQRERGEAGHQVPKEWPVGREEKGGVGRVCWRSHLWRRLCGGARGCWGRRTELRAAIWSQAVGCVSPGGGQRSGWVSSHPRRHVFRAMGLDEITQEAGVDCPDEGL